MKLIFIVGAGGIPDIAGDIEKYAEQLFPRIAARGWDVILAALNRHVSTNEYRNIQLLGLPGLRIFGTEKALYHVCALYHARRLRPDIVHLAGLGAAFFLWAYKLLGCKIVVRCGAVENLSVQSGWFAKAGYRWAEYQLRWADMIIAVTPELARRLRRKGIVANVQIIGNAIDPPAADDGKREISGDYILAVGPITKQENHHLLMIAFRQFQTDHPQIKLVIASGRGGLEYRRKINACRDDKIVMLGRISRPRLIQLYRHARLYIDGSADEGGCNALLEAISQNTPLLLSDIPGNRDLRLDPKHHFNPHDVASILAAMKRAHAHPHSFRVDPGAFPDWDEITMRTIKIYEQLIAEKLVESRQSECE
ncbi:glycosyltransferase family 4 protein [Parasphingorhabdus sp.]|uniref:glycosyltransferase family 4 protein n=1 Tax=Parasphingorhabdus sp. TaxID=2709688 RepID=UPI003D2CF859